MVTATAFLAATALFPIHNLFGSQTPSKPSVPNPATKLTDPAASTSTATTLSDDKHRTIVGARELAQRMLCKPSHLGLEDLDLGPSRYGGILVRSGGNLARFAALNNPKRIIINASGKFVEYQFPAGRLTIKGEPPDVLLVCPDVDPQILPCAGLGNMHPRFGVGYEKLLWFLDAARTHPDELYTVGDYGYLGTTVTTILPCAGLENMNPRFGVGYEKLLWFLDAAQTHPDVLYTVGDYGYLGTTVTTILPYAGLGNMNPRFGVGYEKLLWFLDAAQTHPDELYTVGDYGYLGTTVTTVNNFGDAVSPLLNYIDGIQAQSSYLTVGGGLGINHYNGGIIPPTLMDLNSTACDFVPSQGGPLIIEHTNRIFRRMCCSHQILWISLLMAGSLLLFDPCIRSIIKIIISFIHSSDGNYIKLDTLMSLMQFFGLGQSCAPLFCSVGITSETRKSPFKLLIMMMGAACWLLGSFKGSKHDHVNSALVQFKKDLATQQIPLPNTLLQLKFAIESMFRDLVTSGGGCTQISLFMVAIFLVGKLFTVLVESSSKKKTMDESSFGTKILDQLLKLCAVIPNPESSFWKIFLDQHLKLCFVIPKDSKLRDRVFVAKTIADIQNHGEGKYNDQLHVRFDPVISSRESAVLTITCKLRAKDDDEYKDSMSDLQLIVERVVKDFQLYYEETWPLVCV